MTPDRIDLALPGWSMRRWREGDQAALQRAADDERIARSMSDAWPEPYTAADADFWVREGAPQLGSNWALCLHDEPQGGLGARRLAGFERCNAEVGWWLAPSHWGRGVAPLAAAELLRQTLADPEVTRIFAAIHAGNRPSVRVAEKIGLQLEAVQPRSAFKRGVIIDRHIYALYR